MLNDAKPVWLITGCSTGFGRELAQLIAGREWNLVATARNKSKIENISGDNVLALELDVAKPEQIASVVAAAKDRFGRIDVLVNNAGYGYITSIEEGDENEIRPLFETNVFGLFALTRAVLPIMRTQKSGHIINITSVGGHLGNPGSGYYAATKHAVEGWGKSLKAEVKPLGINVTNVAPGPFRTDWAGRSLVNTPSKIEDYTSTVATRQQGVSAVSGKQAGDPVRAGEAMIKLTEMEDPPLHIVFGVEGINRVVEGLSRELKEIEDYKELGVSTDFPSS
jgi:short-subunit dehydrogenase